MKRFWSFIKHMRRDSAGVAPLKINGQNITDPREKTNALNKKFKSVFTKEDPTPPDLLTASSFPAMQDIKITENGVRKMLEQLKIHKAAGPDAISPRVLKELAPQIAPILTIIFRKSYETGILPKDWREAPVAPVYKKGKKCDPANYRPISLTCISCNILEHIITSNIMKHAATNNIFYQLQHGFREKLSCETQLLEFITDITNRTHQGKQTDVLIMDFSKALIRLVTTNWSLN